MSNIITNNWREFGIEFIEEFEDYDERFSNNGGSYFQPTYSAKLRNKELVIEDTSCGDFGSRIEVTLFVDNKRVNHAYYGTMDGVPYETDFTPQNKGWLLVGRYLGYNIPYIAD